MDFLAAPRRTAGRRRVAVVLGPLEVEIAGLDDALADMLYERYTPYASHGAQRADALRVQFGRDDTEFFFDPPKELEFQQVRIACDGDRARFMSYQVAGWFDVVVDMRKSSPTFGKTFSLELSDENHRQLYIPVGMAHGFCVTSDVADFVYRCGSYYDGKTESGILWNSPELGIPWPTDTPLLSDRDQGNPTFTDYPGPWFP